MKLRELKALVKLANDLDDRGLYGEADSLDFVIRKLSMALSEMYGGQDVGELGHDSYNPFKPGGHHFQKWYDSIKALSTDVVYIHVDYKKIMNNEAILEKFKGLFEVRDSSPESLKKAQDLGSPNPVFGPFANCDAGDFFRVFPMPEVASEYGSKLNEVVFAVADVTDIRDLSRTEAASSPGFSTLNPTEEGDAELESYVKRDPFTAAHDLGHLGADTRTDNWRSSLEQAISILKDCYRAVEIEPMSEGIRYGVSSNQIMYSIFRDIIQSSRRDYIQDIFAYVAGGGSLLDFFNSKYKSNNDLPIVSGNYENTKFRPVCRIEKFRGIISAIDIVIRDHISGTDLDLTEASSSLLVPSEEEQFRNQALRNIRDVNTRGENSPDYEPLYSNKPPLSAYKGKVVLFI